MKTSRGFWADAWGRFRRKPLAMAALAFIGFLVASATPRRTNAAVELRSVA